jgi:hypothetical protein
MWAIEVGDDGYLTGRRKEGDIAMIGKGWRSLVMGVGLAVALLVALAAPPLVTSGSMARRGASSAAGSAPGLPFVHVARFWGSPASRTYLYHLFTYPDDPGDILFVTQNLNPYGGPGIFNPHSLGVWFDVGFDAWTVLNQDDADMPEGAAFNVLNATSAGASFVHEATATNLAFGSTRIDHPLANDDPNAILLVTQKAYGSGILNDHAIGVWYDEISGRWAIFNQDAVDIPEGALFHVLVATAETGAFVHQASAGNSAGPGTYVDHPLANHNPHAILFVTQNRNPGGGWPGVVNDQTIAVTYSQGAGQWAIVNQEGGDMPAGAAFNVVIPHTDPAFVVHEATAPNTVWHTTYVDHPLTNDNPMAYVFVTPNWNPGGVGGIYNNHPIGVRYSAARWAVFNEDDGEMPEGAAFNVLIPNPDAGVFLHRASSTNTDGTSTYVDHPLTNDNPDAIVFVTQNLNPAGGAGGTYNDRAIAVWYNDGEAKWAIFNQGFVDMPYLASFNVLVPVRRGNVFVHEATPENTSGNWTALDHGLANDHPYAMVLVTQNYNPGGGPGTYNDHPLGVFYNHLAGRWAIFNQDSAAMPAGAAFNVLVRPMRVFLPIVLRSP